MQIVLPLLGNHKESIKNRPDHENAKGSVEESLPVLTLLVDWNWDHRTAHYGDILQLLLLWIEAFLCSAWHTHHWDGGATLPGLLSFMFSIVYWKYQWVLVDSIFL